MSDNQLDIIAIDGPAGSGKSITARLVAEKLTFTYLDTGAMYRAVTLKALSQAIDTKNEAAITAMLPDTKIELVANKRGLKVMLDGRDVTRQIRTESVSQQVSTVAAYKGVREWLVKIQQKIGAQGKVVAEGRDIGTVVFPQARLKIFLIASLEERARRRQHDFSQQGQTIDVNRVIQEINQRDHDDRSRETGPLRPAADAIMLDTSHLTIEQQVAFVVEQWHQKIRGKK